MKNVSFITFLFIAYLILVSSSSKIKSKKLKTNKKQQQQTTTVKQTITNLEEEEKHPNYARAYFPDKDCDKDYCFNGRCSRDKSVCFCNEAYANYPATGKHERFCVYKRKSQLAGFLLEFLLGFGIGHLTVGRIAMGVCKLILGMTPLIFKIIVCIVSAVSGDKSDATFSSFLILNFLLIFMTMAYGIWWFIDIFMFAFNKYPDGKGIDLKAW